MAKWFGAKKETAESAFVAHEHNSENENKLLREAQDRFSIARAKKTDLDGGELHAKWRELDRIYRGKQWRDVPEGKSAPVLNFTFSLIESIVPRLTDITPEIDVIARRDPENDKLADALSLGQHYLWYTNRMQKKTSEAVRICMKLGTAIYKVFWDWDAYDGLGDVAYTVVHPMNFFPDPKAYDIDQMDYCFVVTRRSLAYIKKRFPDKGHLVVEDQDWAITEDIDHSSNAQEDAATLTEYWFRDESGNLCVAYYVGNLMLDIIGGKWDDSNEPVYRHNRFPFIRQVNYPVDKHFWGISEIEVIEHVQKLINSLEAQIIDSTRLMSNPIWKVNKKLSGLQEEDAWMFDNQPGSVLWTMDGGVEREPGVSLPANIPEHMERLIFAMEQILGVHDVVQGRKPTGIRTASAIIALQEAANIRVRQKAREMEYSIRELGEQSTWLMLEFYDEPRRIRISGDIPYVTLDVHEALQERMTDVASQMGMVEPDMQAEDIRLNDQSMGTDTMGEIMREVKFPEFDVEVKVGPGVPYSQALLHQQALEFFQAGIIDRQAVLETVNFPGWEGILARIEAQEQALQQAAAGQMEGQSPTPGVQM